MLSIIKILAFISVTSFIPAAVISLALTHSGYEEKTEKHCNKYMNIPEKHLDRIPDACVPYYFNK